MLESEVYAYARKQQRHFLFSQVAQVASILTKWPLALGGDMKGSARWHGPEQDTLLRSLENPDAHFTLSASWKFLRVVWEQTHSLTPYMKEWKNPLFLSTAFLKSKCQGSKTYCYPNSAPYMILTNC